MHPGESLTRDSPHLVLLVTLGKVCVPSFQSRDPLRTSKVSELLRVTVASVLLPFCCVKYLLATLSLPEEGISGLGRRLSYQALKTCV